MPAEAGLKQVKKAEDRAEMADNRQQFVTFKIGTESYGILIERVKEIIKPKRITQVPNTDEYVLGVINLRGQIVPVVNLKEKLNLDVQSIKSEEEERIITVEIDDALIGIRVDEVNEVIWLDEETIEPPPEVAGGIRQEYLRGVGRKEGELLVLVDLETLLFTEDEENEDSEGETGAAGNLK